MSPLLLTLTRSLWTMVITVETFCSRNVHRIQDLWGTSINDSLIPKPINHTQVTAQEYQQIYDRLRGVQNLELESCNIENELNKVGAKVVLQRV